MCDALMRMTPSWPNGSAAPLSSTTSIVSPGMTKPAAPSMPRIIAAEP